jgi:hypothetical protein
MERTTLLDDLGATLDPPEPGPSPQVSYRLDAVVSGRPPGQHSAARACRWPYAW